MKFKDNLGCFFSLYLFPKVGANPTFHCGNWLFQGSLERSFIPIADDVPGLKPGTGDPVNKTVSVAGSGKHRRRFPPDKPWDTLAS